MHEPKLGRPLAPCRGRFLLILDPGRDPDFAGRVRHEADALMEEMEVTCRLVSRGHAVFDGLLELLLVDVAFLPPTLR